MTQDKLISIITSSYNRVHLLGRLLESLENQTDKTFEYILVDDGSNDDTVSFIEAYIKNTSLDITFVKQQHAGKPTGINRALDFATGTLVYFLDSDDYLLPDTIEKVKKIWESIIVQYPYVAGIVGLGQTEGGTIIAGEIKRDSLVINWAELQYVLEAIKGDKVWILKREVLLENRPLVVPNESYIAEGHMINRISLRGHKLYFVNEILSIIEYQEDGLSADFRKVRLESPMSAYLVYRQTLQEIFPRFRASFGSRYRTYVNYIRYAFHNNISIARQYQEQRESFIYLCAFLLGFSLYIQDLWYKKYKYHR